MKVLRVAGGLEARMGGPSESAVHSMLAAARGGTRTLVVFPGPGTAGTVARLADAGVQTRSFALSGHGRARRWGVSLGLIGRLPLLVRQQEVVHAHGAWTATSAAALVAAKLARRPFVLTPHETLTQFDVEKSSPLRRLVKRILRRVYLALADALIFASELERASSLGGRDASPRFAVVAHAVVDDPVPAAHVAPPAGTLTIGYLGRFDAKKNLPILVEAVAAVSSVRLRLAGDGNDPTPGKVAELARALGAEERVELLGWTAAAERAAFLASIDLLALPSAYECFGMAAAEALASGLPVLVSPRTGIGELVRRYGCGLVVEPERAAIAAALASLAADPGWLAELAERARSAGAELGYDAHGRALAAVYEAVTGARRVEAVGAERVAAS